MFQPASISISGPVFSNLLYETCKGSVKQYGFLLGQIIHKEITSITDNEQRQVDISKVIKINSVVPCPSNNYFLGGRVDADKIRKFLGSNFSKVVAWYKYEPFSSLKFTLKDRALHKQFRELFDIPHDLFSVCFLLMETTENFSTYNYQQKFMRYHEGTFDRLDIHILNLSESNNSYKNFEPSSDLFHKILSSLKMDIEKTKGVVAVTQIENAVQSLITLTGLELAVAERTLYDLENEIKLLKEGKYEKPKIKQDKDETSNNLKESVVTNNSMPCNKENSPEMTRRSQKLRTRSDSNKIENSPQSKEQSLPELIKKSPNSKTKGRGRGRKKL